MVGVGLVGTVVVTEGIVVLVTGRTVVVVTGGTVVVGMLGELSTFCLSDCIAVMTAAL